jgi:hypothetical protein
MVMQRAQKSSDQILYLYIAGSLFMLIAFVYLYQKAGSFLIQVYDLI